ncbi:MAG: DUF6788 family protein [Candidatus Hydrogenedentota bacterium]
MHCSQMCEQERAARSRLAQVVKNRALIRATVNVRRVTCGKPGCRCAQGDRHEALYLVCGVKGKKRQLFIPSSMEHEVRQWVANYHAALELLEEISEHAWRRLKQRKEKGDS